MNEVFILYKTIFPMHFHILFEAQFVYETQQHEPLFWEIYYCPPIVYGLFFNNSNWSYKKIKKTLIMFLYFKKQLSRSLYLYTNLFYLFPEIQAGPTKNLKKRTLIMFLYFKKQISRSLYLYINLFYLFSEIQAGPTKNLKKKNINNVLIF